MLEWKSDGWKERKSCHLRIGGDLKKEMKQRVLSGVVYMTKSRGPRTEPSGTIGSAVLVVLATAGSTNSVRTITPSAPTC